VDARERQKHEHFAPGSDAEADRSQSAGPLGRRFDEPTLPD
jgi:hypothetical protein